MYFYHGYAIGVGSTIKDQQFTEAVSALTVGGGTSAADSKFNKNGISFEAHSEVSGYWEKRNGLYYWVTKASVTIKNLKILNRITSDAIKCDLYSEFRGGDYESATAIDADFGNLQVDGTALKIEKTDALSEDYPTFSGAQLSFQDSFSQPWVLDLLVGRRLTDETANTDDLRAAFDAYSEQKALPKLKPAVVCSFVEKISGGGFKSWGPIVAIPNLGNLYLGEVIVWPWMRCLTTFRLELDSNKGSICGGSAGANGTGFPPGGVPPDWP